MQLISAISAHTLSTATIGYSCWQLYLEGNYVNDRTEDEELSEEAKEHRELLVKENIRLDFKVVSEDSLSFCKLLGTNYPSLSDATILMWPGLKEADKDAYNFLLLHQFYYLKHSHDARFSLYDIAISVASFATAYLSTSSPWLAFLAAYGTKFATGIPRRIFAFFAAEEFAIQNATYKQLEGGIRYLKAIKNVRSIYLKCLGYPKEKVERLANGDAYLFFKKANINRRIERIQHEMKKYEEKSSPLIKKSLASIAQTDALIRKIEHAIDNKMNGKDRNILSLI